MYKMGPEKSLVLKPKQAELRCCEKSGPPSFDHYARGASTTVDYYSEASGLRTSDVEYRTATGCTEYHTAASSNSNSKKLKLSFGDIPSRPLASSTQKSQLRKKSEVGSDTPKSIPGQALADAIINAISKGLEPC